MKLFSGRLVRLIELTSWFLIRRSVLQPAIGRTVEFAVTTTASRTDLVLGKPKRSVVQMVSVATQQTTADQSCSKSKID